MYKKRCLQSKNSAISNTFKNKQGQVTLFIILGIVILLAVILLIALRSEIFTFTPGELSPTKKGSVESLISACIEQLGNDALFQIGLQGGYLTVPSIIANDASSSLRVSPAHVVPFWAYGTTTNIPPLQDIKQRIDQYIENNLRSCVFGEGAFAETYDFVEKSDITADTQIIDNSVQFNVEWHLDVRTKEGETVSQLLQHNAESPVKLKKIHELGTAIIEQELAELKFEDITQDLIALEHPKVPVSGLDLSCSKKTWKVTETKETLQDLIRVNLNQLKVQGTEFVEFPEEFPYYENHYVWNLGNEFTSPDLSVQFKYNNYPMVFQVTPTQGNKMQSGTLGGQQLLSALCLQSWKFTYDVVYPVLVQVYDEDSDYTFNLAFSVHLIRNLPNRETPLVARPGSSLSFIDDDVYCGKKTVPVTILTWETIDNLEGTYDQQPLSEADLSMTCIKYECALGNTEFNFANSGYQAGSSINIPYCVGGILRAEKEGYKEDWQRVVTKDGSLFELNLAPLYEFPASKIKVLKHELAGNTPLPGVILDTDETVSIRISFDKNTTLSQLSGQPFHDETLVIASATDEQVQSFQKMEFLADADFTYQLEVRVFDNQQLTGAYATNWTVPFSQLQNAQQLTFHVVSEESGSQDDLFTLLTDIDAKSTLVPLPEFE